MWLLVRDRGARAKEKELGYMKVSSLVDWKGIWFKAQEKSREIGLQHDGSWKKGGRFVAKVIMFLLETEIWVDLWEAVRKSL